MSTSKHTLYDVPVSNNGARCRLILYKKQMPSDEVQIISPMDLGGLKSAEYLSLNPQGKMPCLSINSDEPSSIPESDTICRYLMSRYANVGPSFLPDNYKSNLIARLHDMYITTIQGCLYKAAPPFGIFMTRSKAIDELKRQLDIIDELVEDEGLYLTGDDVSLGDVSLFPTIVFVKFMFPKFGESALLPTKLEKWYNEVIKNDADFAKVHKEILTALNKWSDGGRWDSIWMAGLRDEENETIFDKIINGDIPASVVYDDEDVLAFKDIAPAAPAHVLVIPKDRANLSSLRKASKDHIEILGKMLMVAGDIAKDETLGFTGNGARLVINDGADGGQEVPHLHMHVLGGRKMEWPPG
eukprot:CAMPEP_0116015292 /NCGR_PEP_ID=MMETSP0321-20121206/6755_1 /TAXON_ID=163516 /ORGANISM="Leptocylindrus danicus var. danicus, Strain B650" /LENGTH=355 /DNA_ID=CAMNT_0003485045 /DNA_START=71 /DNA_END=1138 /DNA_ORIENTATION=+